MLGLSEACKKLLKFRREILNFYEGTLKHAALAEMYEGINIKLK